MRRLFIGSTARSQHVCFGPSVRKFHILLGKSVGLLFQDMQENELAFIEEVEDSDPLLVHFKSVGPNQIIHFFHVWRFQLESEVLEGF